MSKHKQDEKRGSAKQVARLSGLAVVALWLAQPPLALWPAAFVALLPWIRLARMTAARCPASQTKSSWGRRSWLIVWSISAIYYFLSLQGLRHAHPLMIFPALALAGYLAVYHVLFVVLLRRAIRRSETMVLAAPVIWVGLECVRNYLLTGISALMLAHSLADLPIAIQIADLFGSYGISFVLVAINVAIDAGLRLIKDRDHRRLRVIAIGCGVTLVAATIGYGSYRLAEPLAPAKTHFALIQRSEPVEYVQSNQRAVEIFQAYLRQTQQAIQAADTTIDAVVWPESMFSAGQPWMTLAEDAVVPLGANVTDTEFAEFVNQNRRLFNDRVAYARAIVDQAQMDQPTQWLVGCGVVRYSQQPEVYSGVVHIDSQGNVANWYGKTHLVMFGEYIPIAPWIPGVRSLIPPGMGLAVGPGPKTMRVGQSSVLPVICIETAVERVVVNQLSELRHQAQRADVIITVTNDGWFDQSSIIEHHLRCGQLVAVATRRPLLSAANNGPTAWINSQGRIVERLATGSEGALIAAPQHDSRTSLYVQIGDLPAWACVFASLVIGLLSRPPVPTERDVTEPDTTEE